MIIDRFEGDYAVIEDKEEGMMNIPREKLPVNAKEGSVLIKVGDGYEVDEEATQSRKASIKNRFDALRKKA